MKFTTINCPNCGEFARGTVETLSGAALLSDPKPDGSVEYSGETEIWWDEQRTVRDRAGRVQLVCYNSHNWFSKVVDPHGLSFDIETPLSRGGQDKARPRKGRRPKP